MSNENPQDETREQSPPNKVISRVYYKDRAGKSGLGTIWFYDQDGLFMFELSDMEAARFQEFLNYLGGIFTDENGIKAVETVPVSGVGEMFAMIRDGATETYET